MKKLSLVIVLLASTLSNDLYAQSSIFKPFKVDMGIDFSFTTKDELSSGMGFYISPIYNVTDKLSIGPRFGFGYAGGGNIQFGPGSVKVGSTSMFSFLMVGDYYFSTEKVRPFVGLGLGMYKRGEASIETGIGYVDISRNAKANFGVKPRIGLNAGHFKMTVDYNFTGEGIHDYIGFTLGAEIGGGFNK